MKKTMGVFFFLLLYCYSLNAESVPEKILNMARKLKRAHACGTKCVETFTFSTIDKCLDKCYNESDSKDCSWGNDFENKIACNTEDAIRKTKKCFSKAKSKNEAQNCSVKEVKNYLTKNEAEFENYMETLSDEIDDLNDYEKLSFSAAYSNEVKAATRKIANSSQPKTSSSSFVQSLKNREEQQANEAAAMAERGKEQARYDEQQRIERQRQEAEQARQQKQHQNSNSVAGRCQLAAHYAVHCQRFRQCCTTGYYNGDSYICSQMQNGSSHCIEFFSSFNSQCLSCGY